MSKKKIVSKKIRKGKFYIVLDGSKTGHPGMIYWKRDNKNIYLSLTVGSTYNKNLIPLKYSITKLLRKSFVNKKPFLGKRKDYGKKELNDMRFSKYDKKTILKLISIKEPRYSKTISRKDKRYYKRINRRKKIKYK